MRLRRMMSSGSAVALLVMIVLSGVAATPANADCPGNILPNAGTTILDGPFNTLPVPLIWGLAAVF